MNDQRMARQVAKMLDDARTSGGTRLVYGDATGPNTVVVQGSGPTAAIVLPALVPVVAGQHCAVLENGPTRLILGPITSGWQTLTLEPDWEQWSSSWYPPSYRIVNGEVELSGLLRRINSDVTADADVANLPAIGTPVRTATTTAMTSTDSLPAREIRLTSAGLLRLSHHGVNLATGQWLSLDDVRFRLTL